MKLRLLKESIRAYLLKLLGVEQLVKQAFVEGYNMQSDNYQHWSGGEVSKRNVWRSVDEAWANSDAQEMFE